MPVTHPSVRKPFNDVVGYVCMLKCSVGGHVVVYDTERGFEIDADYRWIVMHEPSSIHVSAPTLAHARELMKAVASGDEAAWDWSDTGTSLDPTSGLQGRHNGPGRP